MESQTINADCGLIRVLGYTRLGQMAASTRYRLTQYLPQLQQHGIEVDVAGLLDDRYLETRYRTGGRSPLRAVTAYCRRIAQARQSSGYDLVWIYKEALPWVPGWLERRALSLRLPYVVDLDDAEYHRYDTNDHWFVRTLLSKKIDVVMREAAVVVAGNAYVAHRARSAGAARVEVLPTVVDLERYPKAPISRNEVFTIGWIGTPVTASFLRLLGDALREVCRRGPARLIAIGSGPIKIPGVPVEVKPWAEATEVANMQRCDVGIMPLSDTPYNRGKCGLKLIQYMACAKAVVASPIGVNCEIVAPGVNGLLASTTTQWIEALDRLRTDVQSRRQMGESGRRIVEARYSLAIAAPKLAAILRSAVENHRSIAGRSDARVA